MPDPQLISQLSPIASPGLDAEFEVETAAGDSGRTSLAQLAAQIGESIYPAASATKLAGISENAINQAQADVLYAGASHSHSSFAQDTAGFVPGPTAADVSGSRILGTGGWIDPPSGGGGSGDFLADGSVPMTGGFQTSNGTYTSSVADGANAAHVLDTNEEKTNASFKTLSIRNNADEKAFFDKDGFLSTGRWTCAIGVTKFAEFIANVGLGMTGNHRLRWSTTVGAAPHTEIYSAGSGRLEQRVTGQSQEYAVYGRYASATDYVAAALGGDDNGIALTAEVDGTNSINANIDLQPAGTGQFRILNAGSHKGGINRDGSLISESGLVLAPTGQAFARFQSTIGTVCQSIRLANTNSASSPDCIVASRTGAGSFWIGGASESLAFFEASPVGQQAHQASPTVESLRDLFVTFGFMAPSA